MPAGEEATVVGSAAGLDPRDMVSGYRLLWKKQIALLNQSRETMLSVPVTSSGHLNAATGLCPTLLSMRSQQTACL
jgi:hypothetical protein